MILELTGYWGKFRKVIMDLWCMNKHDKAKCCDFNYAWYPESTPEDEQNVLPEPDIGTCDLKQESDHWSRTSEGMSGLVKIEPQPGIQHGLWIQ